jgi:hypothetical protein
MIVAIYVEALTSVLPIDPVSRINRLTPQGKKQERSNQKQNTPTFASILDAMVHIEDPDDEHSFDARA